MMLTIAKSFTNILMELSLTPVRELILGTILDPFIAVTWNLEDGWSKSEGDLERKDSLQKGHQLMVVVL